LTAAELLLLVVSVLHLHPALFSNGRFVSVFSRVVQSGIITILVQQLLALPCFRPTDSRLRLPRAIHASKTLASHFIPGYRSV
jgi:hypothetical protein